MDKKMVNLKINNIPVSVPEGTTVLDAAHEAGFKIPTLCFLKDINEIGACRICVVEVKGARGLVASCVYPVSEGLEVFTNTDKVRKSRQLTLELILSNHRMDCPTCPRSNHCELRELANELGIEAVRYGAEDKLPEVETTALHLVRDNSKCVLCRRCTAVCRKVQEVGVITPSDRGFKTHITSAFERELCESDCISCGQCIQACPTGALVGRDDTQAVWDAINDPKKHVVVAPAPAVRAALGEEFGLPIGTNVEGRMVTALRRLGFDKVFDVDFTADLTIMEEGTEFLDRLQNGGKLPLITSCSPGWIRYCEQHAPDMIENLSSCKSPQQMYGSMVKTFYAEKAGIDPRDIFVVSVMPCVAKKYEVKREEQRLPNGCMPVDVSISTRELGAMIRKAGLLFSALPEGRFDPVLGMSTGAAVIFGASGGVMEAALRTVSEILVGQDAAPVEFHDVRDLHSIREATYTLAGREVRVCAASGAANIKTVLDGIRSGELHYDFVEFMACPGGCINGGGQPIHTNYEKQQYDIPMQRKSCHEFAERMGWSIVEEEQENGVSGFKVHAADRDKLQIIKENARAGKFDILLVFMFDRIGRIAAETPFVVEELVQSGVRVWSVNEGEQRFDSHTDFLTNYIRFWQADGESKKTSIRTKTALGQMVQEGRFRGGKAPFGYRLEKSGVLNKRKHEVLKLVIDEDEAKIVQMMFSLVVASGFGRWRLATFLNEKGILTRDGKNWHDATVGAILHNVLYKGILRSGETYSEPFAELQIIDPFTFDRAQELMQERVNEKKDTRTVPLNTAGQSLLSGNVFCGHCSGRLVLTTSGKVVRMANGETKGVKRIRYVCYNRTRRRMECDGQTGYTMHILDDTATGVLHQIFEKLSAATDDEILCHMQDRDRAALRAEMKRVKSENTRANTEYESLKAEVVRAVQGKSKMPMEVLSELVNESRNRVLETSERLTALMAEAEQDEAREEAARSELRQLRTWADIFDASEIDVRKMIANYIIKRVTVYRDYKIEMELNISVRQFLEGVESIAAEVAAS